MAEAARRGDGTMQDVLETIKRMMTDEEASARPGPALVVTGVPDGAAAAANGASAAAGDGWPDQLARLEAVIAGDRRGERPGAGRAREDDAQGETEMEDMQIRLASDRANEVEDARSATGGHDAPPARPDGGCGAGGLMSAATEAEVGASFDRLSRTILADDPRTLEDLVRELLKPMLREWMDRHLPEMVERMVRQEIERVAARGR